ncbi:MAG: hypothetical protein AAF399_15100 [Bacteroidota bacterium]
MKNPSLLFCFLLGFCLQALWAQPQPGELYREYVWLPDMLREDEAFLRVGGKLDYRNLEAEGLQEGGWLAFGHPLELQGAIRAELVLERVGSHEDTRNLRLKWNDSDWLAVPDFPELPHPQADLMFHNYPVVPIPLAQLRAGKSNAFQLEVDATQRWGWPQNIFYGFTLRVYYDGADRFDEWVLQAVGKKGQLGERVPLAISGPALDEVASVAYLGHYTDLDWEGNGIYHQWHGHPHQGELRNHLGTATEAPFALTWRTDWVPDQPRPMEICARIRLKDGRIYQTQALKGLELARDYSVELCRPYQQPFNWVTREDSFEARLPVHGEVAQADSLLLAWRSWSPCYANGVYLNGHQVFDRVEPCYDYAEHRVPMSASNRLKSGENHLATGKMPLVDGQMVHGMEVQWPGIMMKVKYRKPARAGVHISETTYQGRDHFLITTPQAVYYFDKAGGGLSRMLDREGRDWIAFKKEPWDTYPPAAASSFRGLPNAVFRSEEGGAGHPGHDQCTSRQAGKRSIVSTSLSDTWQWRWTFTETHAEWEVLQVAPDHPYWFLYEGPVGGSFQPALSYFGTNLGGPDSAQYDYYRGQSIYGQWQWAYLGRTDQERVLFLQQMEPDTLTDSFGYLGNTEAGIESPDGMVVFGFGRKENAEALFTQPQRFRVGFWEQAVSNEQDHKQLKKYLRKLK